MEKRLKLHDLQSTCNCQSGAWSSVGKSQSDVKFHTLSAGYGSTNTQRIERVSTHLCALSISQSRNDNHVNTRVYINGDYWYLSVYAVGNAGYVDGGAVCWSK